MPSTPHVANVLAIGLKIFLDDERAPPPGNWLVARDATQFRALLRDHKLTIISFDHDLGCDERGAELPSGQHCMRQLIDDAMERPAAFEHLRLDRAAANLVTLDRRPDRPIRPKRIT